MESKDPTRPRLNISVGNDTQSIANSVSIIKTTTNKYPISTQSSNPKPVFARQEIPHNVTAFGPLGNPIGLTLGIPVEEGLQPVERVDHRASRTALQGEQRAAKERASKGSFRGQMAAPSANVDAPAIIDGASKNFCSG